MYEITAFITPSKDETKKVPVKLLYTDKSTGKGWIETDAMVLPKDWDKKKQIVKKTDDLHKKRNEIISEERHKLETWILDYRTANGVLPDGRKLKELYKPDATNVTPLDTLIEKYYAHRNLLETKPQTVEFYKTGFARLKEFDPHFDPRKCNVVWAKRFELYLYQTPARKGKTVTSCNTVSNYLTCVRDLLNFINDSGIMPLNKLDIEAIKVKPGKRHILTHTPEELHKMFSTDFYDTDKFPDFNNLTRKNLTLARDTYLLSFYTFLRGADFNPDKWIWERKPTKKGEVLFLTVKLKKTADSTGAIVSFPPHPTALEIMARYPETKGVPPIGYTRVKTYIQRMGRLCGITDKVKLENPRRDFKENEEVEKCDLMVMHAARGAGMTYAYYVGGMPIADIAKRAGIKIATFEATYLGNDDDYVAEGSEKAYGNMPKLTFSVQEVKAVGA